MERFQFSCDFKKPPCFFSQNDPRENPSKQTFFFKKPLCSGLNLIRLLDSSTGQSCVQKKIKTQKPSKLLNHTLPLFNFGKNEAKKTLFSCNSLLKVHLWVRIFCSALSCHSRWVDSYWQLTNYKIAQYLDAAWFAWFICCKKRKVSIGHLPLCHSRHTRCRCSCGRQERKGDALVCGPMP